MTHIKILNILQTLRESHPHMKWVFLEGSCMNLFVMLKQIFPKAEAFFDLDHIVTKIDDRFYDITGEVFPDAPTKFTKTYAGRVTTNKIFDQMYTNTPQTAMDTTNDVQLNVTYGADKIVESEVVINGNSLVKEASKDTQGLEYVMLHKLQTYINDLETVKGMLSSSIESCNKEDMGNKLTVDGLMEMDYDVSTGEGEFFERLDLKLNDQTIFRAISQKHDIDTEGDLDEYFRKHLRDIHYKLGKFLYEK